MYMQFGLQDSTLIRNQGLIAGKWVDARDGSTIRVTSMYLTLCSRLLLRLVYTHRGDCVGITL